MRKAKYQKKKPRLTSGTPSLGLRVRSIIDSPPEKRVRGELEQTLREMIASPDELQLLISALQKENSQTSVLAEDQIAQVVKHGLVVLDDDGLYALLRDPVALIAIQFAIRQYKPDVWIDTVAETITSERWIDLQERLKTPNPS